MPDAPDILDAYPELLFPKERVTVRAHELAGKLDCTLNHIFALYFEGSLDAVDITGRGNTSDRRHIRFPVTSYYNFLRRRLRAGWTPKDEPDAKQLPLL